jgi:D-alanine-D-alanine ligase-like ATP-grasp enzyme
VSTSKPKYFSGPQQVKSVADLSDDEAKEFLTAARAAIKNIDERLARGEADNGGDVPADPQDV